MASQQLRCCRPSLSETVSTTFTVPAARFQDSVEQLFLAWSPKPPSSSPNLVYSQAVPPRGGQVAVVLRAAARWMAEVGQVIGVFGC